MWHVGVQSSRPFLSATEEDAGSGGHQQSVVGGTEQDESSAEEEAEDSDGEVAADDGELHKAIDEIEFPTTAVEVHVISRHVWRT